MTAFPGSHRSALTLKQREASSTDCDSVFQPPALLSGMYHVVSAAFICSIFSVPPQQLHAELEMCRAGDAALELPLWGQHAREMFTFCVTCSKVAPQGLQGSQRPSGAGVQVTAVSDEPSTTKRRSGLAQLRL